MIYSVKFIHKIKPASNDIWGSDIFLTEEEAACPRLLGKALRDQGPLGKGERVRDLHTLKTNFPGTLVVYPPKNSVWHALTLTPKGDWIPQADLR